MKKIMLSLGIAIVGITAFINRSKVAAAHKAIAIAKAINHTCSMAVKFDFYSAILKGLGVNETPEKIKFLKAWRQGEGGQARNNPFNTTKDIPGDADTKYNSCGVRNYPDPQTGLQATIATLTLPYYKDIIALLKKDDVTAEKLAHCVSLKKWGTGKNVKKVLAMGNINPPPIAA
jgi:hypothetical protein